VSGETYAFCRENHGEGHPIVRIHAHDEDELQSLLLYLTRTPDTVVTALSDLELEVSFLGSLNDHAQRKLLNRRLRAWRPERPPPRFN
jgi:hypothetical protein